MKKKGNFRKVVSGLLAGMTMLSTVLSPMTAYAAEIQPEEKPPLYEEVKDLLDEDEVVTAKDYEIETGSVFDVKSDYTGLEIKDDNKVKVTFEEAKNDKNEDFTTDHVDTYKAVYYVEPVNQEHPKYQITVMIIDRMCMVTLINIVSMDSRNKSPSSISSSASTILVIASDASTAVFPEITPAALLTTCWPTSKTAIVILNVFVTR